MHRDEAAAAAGALWLERRHRWRREESLEREVAIDASSGKGVGGSRAVVLQRVVFGQRGLNPNDDEHAKTSFSRKLRKLC